MPSAIQRRILERAAETPEQVYLCQPIDRNWHQWTWAEAVREARHVAAGLLDLGLSPGDRVGLVSRNCAHWILADMAMILAGLVSVPIYPTANAGTIRQVLGHSGAKACFIGKLEHPEDQLAGIPHGLETIAFPYPGARGDHDWERLAGHPTESFELNVRDSRDTATILYTSGSTGEPKGAVHSYANFAFVGRSLNQALGVRAGERVFSYLPLSHCTERAYVEAVSLYAETTLYFSESLETFMEDLAHARPTLFGSVPRLWKRFQLGVLEKVPQEKLDRLLRIPLVSALVRRRIKRELGLDQADWFASGSAPLAVSLLQWWDRLGMRIHEGWGMTETFAYGTQIGRGVEPRFGTISRALPEVEFRIGADSELMIRCPCIMTGYYRNDELTEASFDGDGFFHTGDRAIIEDGWVTITGRVKEIFKTAKGKYIAPVPIESLLARNVLVEIACVTGSGLTQPVALVQLAEHAPADRDQLRAGLEQTLEAVNRELEPHERLGRIIVVADPWTVENELLTPTLKIRREAIEARHAGLIARDDESARVMFEADSPAGDS